MHPKKRKRLSKKDRTDICGNTAARARAAKAAKAAKARARKFYYNVYRQIIFFYDSLVRRVWIDEKKRPIVRVTGSHQHSCIFGAISMKGEQLFRQYDKFDGDTFLDYLKKLHNKFPKCYLFMDTASPHYKSKKVLEYFMENKIL